jgi:hypothetical protein
METTTSKQARPWWRCRGVLWGVLFILGGLACLGHALIVPATNHDVTHTQCQQGPCTLDNAPWAWALGGGILLVTGIGKVGYSRYTSVPQDDHTSAA